MSHLLYKRNHKQLFQSLIMGSCLRAPDRADSPYIDYQKLNIDSLLDLWCPGQVNQIIQKFNKFCQNKGTKKVLLKQLPQFFPQLSRYYPYDSFHKKIFSLLDHNNDSAINSRQMLWGLTLILKLEIKQLGQVLFSLYRTGNNHFLTQGQFRDFLIENSVLLSKRSPKFQIFQAISFIQFTAYVNDNFNGSMFRQIFDCTRSSEEIKITESLRASKGTISMNRDETVWVIDAKWFIQWKSYIESKYSLPPIHFSEGGAGEGVYPQRRSTIANAESILVNLLEDRQFTDKDRLHNSHKPSKIDNSHLQSEFQGQLKEGLEIYQHLVFLPKKLWMIFKQQYGGGPELKVIYPNINQLFFTEVFISPKGKFSQGYREKKMISYNSKINVILQIQNSDKALYSIYKRNLGEPLWTKVSADGTVADQCIYNNSYVCKIPLANQQQFLSRYNQSAEPKSKINYGQTITMNDRNQSIVGYVIEILDEKVKIHLKGKSYENDIIFNEDQFLKIAKSSKFQYQYNSLHSGLTNLGNTCYINSVLQCLMSTPIFQDFLVKQSYKQLLQGHKQSKEYPIIKQLSELAKTCNGTNKYVRPGSLITLIKKVMTVFDNYEQHDAEEFFVSLLHQLSDQLSIKKVSIGKVDSLELIDSNLKQKYCMVQKFFGGIEKRVIKCEKCKNTIIKKEQFYSLGLPVPQLEYGYYFVIFYPGKVHGEFLPITQYGAKLKKNATFLQFVETFSSLIGKKSNILNFAEVAKSEFRKHFRQSHNTKTLTELYIQTGDIINVYEQKALHNINRRKYAEEKKKHFPKDLKKGALIDIFYITEYQVASFISYDEPRKKVKYESLDIQQEVDEAQVYPFLSKIYEKPHYNIEVLHRRYNQNKRDFEYFLKPFMISIPEWIKWSDAVQVINEEAMRFVDEAYWQKLLTTGFTPRRYEEDDIRKRNGSDSLPKSRIQSAHIGKNLNQSQIQKQIKVKQPEILFPDTDTNKVPFTIHVLNRSNQMCGICNKKIRSKLDTKGGEQKSVSKECKGCTYDPDLPIGLIFDIKRVMFVLDWEKTLAVNPEPNKITYHISSEQTEKMKDTDQFKIEDCLKLYANIEQNIEVTCQKCKHPTSSLQCLVSKPPNILLIHLKRFKYSNGYFSKIQSQIQCPLNINLSKITTDQSSSLYELYGIVCHMGSGFGGHYYSYIRKEKKKWILCDDHFTKPIDDLPKNLNLKHVYLLLFKKVQIDGSLLTLSL